MIGNELLGAEFGFKGDKVGGMGGYVSPQTVE
jgi:hypothetical protein